MAEFFETPESENKEKIEKLGAVIEMKTFKTNIKPEFIPSAACSSEKTKPEVKHEQSAGAKKESICLKILCVGDYSNWSKGVYIDDYMVHSGPPIAKDRGPLIGFNFRIKILCRKNNYPTSKEQTTNQIRLQIWEMAESERFSEMLRVHYKNASGAIVFWGARSSSLANALSWRTIIKKYTDRNVPVVLLVDNVSISPVSWIGHDKIISSEEEMNEFCHQHEILAWFEMFSRETGEKSVFGQAVSRLVDEIMKQKQRQKQKQPQKQCHRNEHCSLM